MTELKKYQLKYIQWVNSHKNPKPKPKKVRSVYRVPDNYRRSQRHRSMSIQDTYQFTKELSHGGWAIEDIERLYIRYKFNRLIIQTIIYMTDGVYWKMWNLIDNIKHSSTPERLIQFRDELLCKEHSYRECYGESFDLLIGLCIGSAKDFRISPVTLSNPYCYNALYYVARMDNYRWLMDMIEEEIPILETGIKHHRSLAHKCKCYIPFKNQKYARKSPV